MTPADLATARDLLLDGADLDAACEAVGVTRRTLERAWQAEHGTTPARWLRAARAVKPARAIPPVFYRLSEHDRERLDRRALAAGASANELARSVLQEWLDRSS